MTAPFEQSSLQPPPTSRPQTTPVLRSRPVPPPQPPRQPVVYWWAVSAAAALAVLFVVGLIVAARPGVLKAGPAPAEAAAPAPPDEAKPGPAPEDPPRVPPAHAVNLRPADPPAQAAPRTDAEAISAPQFVPPPFTWKRRKYVSEEELVKQLRGAPEISLDDKDRNTSVRLVAAARNLRTPLDHPVLEPLTQRSDLHGLPVRMGAECQAGKEAADNLQVLSRKLRAYLAASVTRDGLDPRPNPTALRRHLLEGKDGDNWISTEAVPTLVQMFQAEDKQTRLLLVEMLARNPRPAAAAALARRALFDTSDEVREAAVRALVDRPRDDYRQLLLDGLRYPWAPVADHAADALASLRDHDAVPQLVYLLDEPDPAAPVLRKVRPLELEAAMRPPEPRPAQPPANPFVSRPLMALEQSENDARTTRILGNGGILGVLSRDTRLVVHELVRVNHMRNCLLCHAPAVEATDPVRGLVPTPGEPLPPPTTPYYGGDKGIFVRADITYLKQDFAVPQPVARHNPWPAHQRFDYLVRARYAADAELAQWAEAKKVSNYPQRQAVLFALRELTGKDAGESSQDWRRALAWKGRN